MKILPMFVMLMTIPVAHAEKPSLDLTIEVMERESSGMYNAKKAKSYGIMAFEKATFDELKIKAGMPKLRWKNPIHQLKLWSWAYDHGYADKWVGYRMYMHTGEFAAPPMDSITVKE